MLSARGKIGGYTYQASAVSQIYTVINTPTTHYCGPNPYPWHSSNPDSWTRANYPTQSTAKSIFDPCPYGYRVPTSNANSNGNSDFFGFTATLTWSGTPVNTGQLWLGSWWPTSGRRDNNSAVLNDIGNYGWYWLAAPCTSSTPYSAYNLSFSSGSVSPASNTIRSIGISVRCVQEERKKFLAQRKAEQQSEKHPTGCKSTQPCARKREKSFNHYKQNS